MSSPRFVDDYIVSGERQDKWDRRFIALAKHISQWSKDPSTKVGAVIVDRDMRVVSLGYNGFAQRVDDIPELYADRDSKYNRIIHGDMNAMIFAERSIKGCSLYTIPFLPCSRCAVVAIQRGIVRVVAPALPDELKDRWGDSVQQTEQMFAEAGVQWTVLT